MFYIYIYFLFLECDKLIAVAKVKEATKPKFSSTQTAAPSSSASGKQ